jgi:hypothetical protein
MTNRDEQRDGERRDAPATYRPALVKLSDDVEDLQTEMLDGFDDREQLLAWLQRLSIRTLGEIPQRVFWEFARQFVLDQRVDIEQGVLLAALLRPVERDRDADLPKTVVDELRERFVATQIRPAYHRAYRELRKDATEYIDESDDETAHDPGKQRHPAMRPGLRELDDWQQRALSSLLDGFDDGRAILDWGTELEHATHGELDEIEPPGWADSVDGAVASTTDTDFIERCYRERSARSVLTADGEDARELRELFAAFWIVPAFNRGVRVLSGRAGELPDVDVERSAPKQL